MILRWSVDALSDRLAIFDYVSERDFDAACSLDRMLEERASGLTSMPRLGRPGLIEGTRELTVHANYRLVYEVSDAAIMVLNVIHARRDWP